MLALIASCIVQLA